MATTKPSLIIFEQVSTCKNHSIKINNQNRVAYLTLLLNVGADQEDVISNR